jgi:hypothetical protein
MRLPADWRQALLELGSDKHAVIVALQGQGSNQRLCGSRRSLANSLRGTYQAVYRNPAEAATGDAVIDTKVNQYLSGKVPPCIVANPLTLAEEVHGGHAACWQ